MALTTCSACHGQVSSDAKTCPHCGKPLDTDDRIARAIPGILGCLAVLYFISQCGAPAPTPAPTPPPAQNREEIAACRADIKCTGQRNAIAASFACQRELEAYAKYAARWSDDWPSWVYNEWPDTDKTAIVYLGDRLQLQNGFGAWENYIYSCTYDPDRRRVLEVYLAAGRI